MCGIRIMDMDIWFAECDAIARMYQVLHHLSPLLLPPALPAGVDGVRQLARLVHPRDTVSMLELMRFAALQISVRRECACIDPASSWPHVL